MSQPSMNSMELQSWNAKFESKSTFCAVWLWNLTDDLWNNRAILLCYFKLCASFRSHRSIQTGVTVRKRPILGPNLRFILSHVTLEFGGWPWKTTGHLFYATPSFVHHFTAICKLKLELWSRNTQNRAKCVLTFVALTFDLWPWPFCMDITFINGNNSWRFNDDRMMET